MSDVFHPSPGDMDFPADPQIHRIRVINRNLFTIRDRYDGVPYEFRPNEFVDLPLDAAQHILGYPGEPDYRALHMAKRWGWNRPEHVQIDPDTRKMRFQELAGNIEISVETFEIRRVSDPTRAQPIDDPQVPPDLSPDELAAASTRLGKTSRKYATLPVPPGAKE